MKQIVDDLEQVRCNMDGVVFMRTVVGETEAWRKTCRGASKSTHVAESTLFNRVGYVAKEILKQSADTVDKKVGNALLGVFASFARVKGYEQDTADD
eukprot:8818421-Pyramimonas_sp.AAC.1